MPIITVPKILREKLTEEGADALVSVINQSDKTVKEDALIFLEERFERRLSDVKAEIIKWMFIFWAGQITVLTGILFAFFRR